MLSANKEVDMDEDTTKTEAEIDKTEVDAAEGDSEPTTEIRDTDIVFDCPHCGHNLAIDYRGAGLMIDCVNCGQSVLVPIPSGMQIDDLDLEPGEILKQLFATRRNLQKAEARAAELEGALEDAVAGQEALHAALETALRHVNALRDIASERAALHVRTDELLSKMASEMVAAASSAAAVADDAEEVAGDDGDAAADPETAS